jgi:hydroxymethylbilane synthase
LAEKRHHVVGSKSDKISIRHLARIIGSLSEAHPKHEFTNYYESVIGEGFDGDGSKDLTGALHLLAKKDIDMLVVDAVEAPYRGFAKAEVAAITRRGNPYDVFISEAGKILDELPEKACLAADVPIRIGQLLFYRPDLNVIEEQGDFDDLFGLLSKEEINGFVFTATDVEVLNVQDKVAEVFTSSICMPVAGQGSQMIVTRKRDTTAFELAREINDAPSAREIDLERAFMMRISKNGKGPIGVLVSVEEQSFKIEAAIAAYDGSEKVTGNAEGKLDKEESVLERLTKELLESGAKEILKNAK